VRKKGGEIDSWRLDRLERARLVEVPRLGLLPLSRRRWSGLRKPHLENWPPMRYNRRQRRRKSPVDARVSVEGRPGPKALRPGKGSRIAADR
jgi:hypothetical protein